MATLLPSGMRAAGYSEEYPTGGSVVRSDTISYPVLCTDHAKSSILCLTNGLRQSPSFNKGRQKAVLCSSWVIG
jgi:hypothetical protein